MMEAVVIAPLNNRSLKADNVHKIDTAMKFPFINSKFLRKISNQSDLLSFN